MKKCIVLCADDYGQAPAISQGILELIKQKRLSATTCMVNSPFWEEHAKWLLPHQDEIDIGLHFNLTEGKPLSPLFQTTYGETLIPLPRLIRLSLLRQLNKAALMAECHAQLDEFQAHFSSLPRFIDGHQHVHQFPVVREALLEVYKARLSPQKVYVRLVNGRFGLKDVFSEPKKIVIYLMGGKELKRLFEMHEIPHNATFGGIYSFAKRGYYHTLFPQFLREIESQGIIMCHPALPDPGLQDVMGQARYEEYQYLNGPKFLKDCEREEVFLGRF